MFTLKANWDIPAFSSRWNTYGHLVPGADVSYVDRLDEKTQEEGVDTATGRNPRAAKIPVHVIDLIGGGEWNRTTDLRVMSPSL